MSDDKQYIIDGDSCYIFDKIQETVKELSVKSADFEDFIRIVDALREEAELYSIFLPYFSISPFFFTMYLFFLCYMEEANILLTGISKNLLTPNLSNKKLTKQEWAELLNEMNLL